MEVVKILGLKYSLRTCFESKNFSSNSCVANLVKLLSLKMSDKYSSESTSISNIPDVQDTGAIKPRRSFRLSEAERKHQIEKEAQTAQRPTSFMLRNLPVNDFERQLARHRRATMNCPRSNIISC